MDYGLGLMHTNTLMCDLRYNAGWNVMPVLTADNVA